MTVTEEKLGKLLELQDRMNSVINAGWRTAGNAWLRAAWIESAELMDYLNWKWWKHQEFNEVQAHIELVDIFHFLLSQAIVDGLSPEILISSFSDDIKAEIQQELGDMTVLSLVEEFVSSLLDGGVFIDYYCLFSIICDELGLEFDELYRLYVGKNVLNIFRQDHGYKTGEYVKQWQSPVEPNGLVEDNVYLEMFMEDALKDQPEDIYIYLYSKLEEEYKHNLIVK